jgi:predicted MFS family arabinose efflux permease
MPVPHAAASAASLAPAGRWRNVALLNGVSGLSQLAQFGVLYPLLAMWLDSHGMPAHRIGVVVASVWPGMLLGNLLTPVLSTRLTARVVALGSCVGTALLALVLPLIHASQFVGWVSAAAGFGFLVGLRWVSVEGWVFGLIEGPLRGRLIAVHETIIYAAQALGPVLIAAVGLLESTTFILASAIAAAAVLPLLLTSHSPRLTLVGTADRRPLRLLVGMWHARRSDPSMALGLLSGIIDGALLGMLSVHLIRAGQNAVAASLMLAVFGMGGLLSQIPLGWLCDRRGLKYATRVTALIGLAGVLLLVLSTGFGVSVGVALLGALAANGLTLSTNSATEHARKTNGDMIVAISRVSIAFTIGSGLGPVAAGYAIGLSAQYALPAITTAGCLGLWVWANSRADQKAKQEP